MPKARVGMWLMKWDEPRLLAFIDYLEAHGGVLENRTLTQISQDMGIVVSSVFARKKWALRYGLIRTKSMGRPGRKRAPDRYELLMSAAEWRQKGPEHVAAIRDAHLARARQLRELSRPPKPVKAKPRRPITTEDKAQARIEAKEALAAAPYPDFVVDELAEDEVEAWVELAD